MLWFSYMFNPSNIHDNKDTNILDNSDNSNQTDFKYMNNPFNPFIWYENIFNINVKFWTATIESNLSIKDKRFNNHLWQDGGFYQYMANAYLLLCKNVLENTNQLDLNENEKNRYLFFTKQYLDAIAPSNFIASNPQAVQAIIDTNGQSIIDGILNYLQDVQKGRISQSQDFIIGENLAITAGDIIEKNYLYEFIHYHNDNIKYINPILIVPPCINKYYVLDMQAHNSLVAYLIAKGFDVYLISWKNIKAEVKNNPDNYSWDSYIQSIQNCITYLAPQASVHVMGFCIGGTLASCAIASLEDDTQKNIASLSLLTTLLDFSNTGILGHIVDKAQFEYSKPTLLEKGIMSGKELSHLFNSLRAQDLIWKYVNENYLQGKTPPSFDILHWNSDSTNMPANMYCWYMENTYLNNTLINGTAIIQNKPLNLTNIKAPIYAVGCEEDHIVPWQSALKSVQYLSKNNTDITFILSASGHIAGIINPPNTKSKRYYYIFDDIFNLDKMHNKIEGSWWINWQNWLEQHSQKITKQQKNKLLKHNILYKAPGEYIKEVW